MNNQQKLMAVSDLSMRYLGGLLAMTCFTQTQEPHK